MTLFAAHSIATVWRRLRATRGKPEPTDAAFTQGRPRLGVAPLRQLFLETARPIVKLPAIWHGFVDGKWPWDRPYDQHRPHKATLHNLVLIIGPSVFDKLDESRG